MTGPLVYRSNTNYCPFLCCYSHSCIPLPSYYILAPADLLATSKTKLTTQHIKWLQIRTRQRVAISVNKSIGSTNFHTWKLDHVPQILDGRLHDAVVSEVVLQSTTHQIIYDHHLSLKQVVKDHVDSMSYGSPSFPRSNGNSVITTTLSAVSISIVVV